jgi:hypothetical protein
MFDAHASDRGGDTLTYSWAQTAPSSPQGSFSSLTSSTPSWTAPTVAKTTVFALAVTVSNGKGGSTTCSVSLFVKTSTDPSFIAEVHPLLVQCMGSCHYTLAEYENLLNAPVLDGCKTQKFVTPGDPDHSVMFERMAGTSCGDQMPPGGPYLGTDDLNLVHTWISQGALNN